MIGNKIRDIEDDDCYNEGTVVSMKPLKYRKERTVWNGEEEMCDEDVILEIQYWILESYLDNEWKRIYI